MLLEILCVWSIKVFFVVLFRTFCCCHLRVLLPSVLKAWPYRLRAYVCSKHKVMRSSARKLFVFLKTLSFLNVCHFVLYPRYLIYLLEGIFEDWEICFSGWESSTCRSTCMSVSGWLSSTCMSVSGWLSSTCKPVLEPSGMARLCKSRVGAGSGKSFDSVKAATSLFAMSVSVWGYRVARLARLCFLAVLWQAALHAIINLSGWRSHARFIAAADQVAFSHLWKSEDLWRLASFCAGCHLFCLSACTTFWTSLSKDAVVSP